MKPPPRIRIGPAICGIVCAACLVLVAYQCVGPDQSTFSEALFWREAEAKVLNYQESNRSYVTVIAGSHTILMTNEGRTHGRRSTAHASHWAFYCTLPDDLKESGVYTVTREAGTLSLGAFAGYNDWYLDTVRPAEGTVRVRSVRPDTIVAEVSIRATAVSNIRDTQEADRPRRDVSRNGVITFSRQKIEAR